MNDQIQRIRIRVAGNVQGVGFRPFVWNRATAMGLAGWVLNDASGVTIEVQGGIDQVDEFLSGFRKTLPPLAMIDSLRTTGLSPVDETHFEIRHSANEAGKSTPISADVAVCDDCLAEMRDDHDRRFRYPFINCTNCGPRFTIINDIPYDRASTTMNSFEMCPQCQTEYDDPTNRRFHAQPNACPECGPRIWFVSQPADEQFFESALASRATQTQPLDAFRSAIRNGQIVAVKGIGGFHLACDATNSETIKRLRERKGRIGKPFAVMVADVRHAESFATVRDDERRLLESKERPIVLLRKRRGIKLEGMLDAVAPGNEFVGVMLPYSPLHYLLIQAAPPLLMTSGNVSDDPIVRRNDESHQRLGAIADGFLLHDRDINVVCDDSVVRCVDASVLPIRRSRGFAPMPLRLDSVGPSVLAVGGEIKSTFCVTKGDYAYVSQHIGDVGNIETLDALKRNVQHFLKLFRVEVEAVVADLHPGYLSAQWARGFADSLEVPLIRVQHHFSHAASLIAEHALPTDRSIIACCFDGTGYGADGAIWGGEFMIADGHDFERIAHLKYFSLPGGDASIRHPCRTALALLNRYDMPWDQRLACVSHCPPSVLRVLEQQLERNVNCVPTSSVGRLFDAVASLVGIRQEVTYEAQAAIEMEALASEVIDEVDPAEYAFDIVRTQTAEIGCGAMMELIRRDVIDGVDRRKIAANFHHAVAVMIVDVCVIARKRSGVKTVGLTGGVFQNVLLLKLALQRLHAAGFETLTHSIVPPNDGGLALGQALIARNRMQRDQPL